MDKVIDFAKKDQRESYSKPFDYTLFNQIITFEFLMAHLCTAAYIPEAL